MGKKWARILLLICIVTIVLTMVVIACADIPAGVKKEYKYNTRDDSIIEVKKQLQKLGYFDKDAQFSNFVSDDLKKAVISFQKQNNLKTNGAIDKNLLELLFSDDAVDSDGKKREQTEATTIITDLESGSKTVVSETENRKVIRTDYRADIAQEETQNEEKNKTVSLGTIALYFFGFVAVYLLCLGVAAAIKAKEKAKEQERLEEEARQREIAEKRQKELIAQREREKALALQKQLEMIAQRKREKAIAEQNQRELMFKRQKDEFVSILERYKEIRQDERCKKAIREAGIIYSLLASYGEFLLLPCARYQLRYDSNVVLRAQNQCGITNVSALDTIVRNGIYNQNGGKTIFNSWAARKLGAPIDNYFADIYEKVMYLFSSLVSSGIISGNDDISKEAFFLLVWECICDEANERNNLLINAMKEANQIIIEQSGQKSVSEFLQNIKLDGVGYEYLYTVYALYEIMDIKIDAIYVTVTMEEYAEKKDTMFRFLYEQNKNRVEAIVEEIEKRRYISNLLKGDNRPRVNIGMTDGMSPATFEKLVEVLFNKMGYDSKATKLSGDQGVDVIAVKKGRKVVIQAKCYQGSVGNSAVQEVAAGKQFYKADEAYVVTNSSFTKSAVELAHANNVVLWGRADLEQKLDKHHVYVSEIEAD